MIYKLSKLPKSCAAYGMDWLLSTVSSVSVGQSVAHTLHAALPVSVLNLATILNASRWVSFLPESRPTLSSRAAMFPGLVTPLQVAADRHCNTLQVIKPYNSLPKPQRSLCDLLDLPARFGNPLLVECCQLLEGRPKVTARGHIGALQPPWQLLYRHLAHTPAAPAVDRCPLCRPHHPACVEQHHCCIISPVPHNTAHTLIDSLEAKILVVVTPCQQPPAATTAVGGRGCTRLACCLLSTMGGPQSSRQAS